MSLLCVLTGQSFIDAWLRMTTHPGVLYAGYNELLSETSHH